MTSGNATTFSWDAVARHLRELTLGEYEILTELGRGGMAAVYLAHEHALNRKVALKVMSPSIMMTEGMVDRFYAEAVTQANLTHANIVGVHAVRRDQDLHYFAMHYVPGQSLQQVLRSEHAANRQLSLPVIQSLLHQIGSALAYAHRRGVIHRDIKPANVLLNADGDAVVTDFGIAKVASSPSQTMTGTVVGTAPYMSPEQCYAAELTGASDQYSLGILAYELLTGNPPFLGNSFAVMQAHTLEAPPPIGARRPDCPPEFEAVVMKMLSKRPEDRYTDVHAALNALETRPASSRVDDPVRANLVRLADVAGVEASLGEVLRVPLSPMPRTRRGGPSTPGSLPRVDTPPTHRPLSAESSRVVMLRLGDPPGRVESGELLRLEAAAMDIHGAPLDGLPLRWSSSNPRVARVQPDTGEIEALAPGSADIVVSCENAVATARLIVREAVAVRIVGVGVPKEIEVGDRVSLRVEVFDARGGLLDRPVRWSMATSPSASLTADGVVSARAPGTALVTATVDGTSTEFRFSIRGPKAVAIELSEIPGILAVGESLGISATARDKRANVLTGRTVVWTSSDPSIATIDPGGSISGLAIGETTLEARCDDARTATHVSVGVVPITSLEISGIPERLMEGTRKRIEVVAKDPDGRIRAIPALWTSSAPSVAVVEASNQLTALSPGHATLRVRCGSSERSFPIEVRENVAISQRALSVLSSVPRPAASWLIKAALAAGSIALVALIAFIATRDRERSPAAPAPTARVDTSTVPVQPPPVVTPAPPVTQTPPVVAADTTLQLRIAPVAPTMRVNQSVTARLQASRGGVPTETPAGARWRSSNTNVFRVDSRNGRITAVGEGSAMVIARIGNDSTWIPIRVERIAVTRVSIDPTPALTSLRVGDSARASAKAYDGNGNELSARTVVWSVEPAGVARVDAGFVRGTAEGAAKLIATVDDTRDTMSLTILARPRPVPVDTPKVEVKGTEVKTPPAPATGGISAPPVTPPSSVPAVPPVSAADVSAAASEVTDAITSKVVERVRNFYLAGTAEDARRLRVLTRAMEGASDVRLISDARSVTLDVRQDAERPTARVRRTLEFASRFVRPTPALLELELIFTRDGANWRLRSFRILNNPSY